MADPTTILDPNVKPEDIRLEHIYGYIERITNLALSIFGGIAVLFLLIGAFEYLTAYGNEEKANKGKTTIMWAIIGLVVILLAKVIMETLKNLLQ